MPTVTFGENSTDTYTGVSEDTYVRGGAYANTNYDSDTEVELQNHSDSQYDRKPLFKFDISALAGMTVLDATLYFYQTLDSQPTNTWIAICTRDWGETTATWNKYDGVNAWGANHDKSTELWHGTPPGTTGAYVGYSTAALVTYIQNVLDGLAGAPADHANFIMWSDDTTTTKAWKCSTSEQADGLRPYLEIEYSTGTIPVRETQSGKVVIGAAGADGILETQSGKLVLGSLDFPGVGTRPVLRVGGVTDTEARLGVDALPEYLSVRFQTYAAGFLVDDTTKTGSGRHTLNLTGLTPSTGHGSRARVLRDIGWSPWSDWVPFTTFGPGYLDPNFLGCPPTNPGIYINPDSNPPTNRLGFGWYTPLPGQPLRGTARLVFRWLTPVPIWDVYISDDLGASWALIHSNWSADSGVDGDTLRRYTLDLDTTGYADSPDYRLRVVSTNTADDDVDSLSFCIDNDEKVKWWRQSYGNLGDRFGKLWAQEGETDWGAPTGDPIWYKGSDGGIGAIRGHKHAAFIDRTVPLCLGADITIRFYIWSGEGGRFQQQGRDDTEGILAGVALFASGASSSTAKGLWVGVNNYLTWGVSCCGRYLTSTTASVHRALAQTPGHFFPTGQGSALSGLSPIDKMWFKAMKLPQYHGLEIWQLVQWPVIGWRNGPMPGDDLRLSQYTCARRWEQYALRVRAELDPGDASRVRVRARVDGMGVTEPSGSYWHHDEYLDADEEFTEGAVGLMSYQAAADLYGQPNGARVFISWSALPLEPGEPPDIPPYNPPPWNPVQEGEPCTLILQVYDENREFVEWEVGTDRYHANPYLLEPSNYGEQEIDPVNGAATIGQAEVTIADRRQIPGDQDTGWVTERLGINDVGIIHGRRCRLIRFVDWELGWVVIADGPAGPPRMDESYAAFQWVIRDTRETERKVRAFVEASTSWLLPMGVGDGWGAYVDSEGDDQWLVPPTDPLVGHYSYDPMDDDPKGFVELMDYWAGPFSPLGTPIGDDQEIDEAVQVLPDVRDRFYSGGTPLGDPRPVLYEWPELEILWRLEASGDPWTVVQPTHLLVDERTAKPRGETYYIPARPIAYVKDCELADGTAVLGAYRILLRGNGAAGTFPTDGQSVEIAIRWKGPPTDFAPLHIEGLTTGQFLKKLYDGEYSYPDPLTGDVVPTGIRYAEADLLRMTDPVLLRITEPVEDGRAWAEEMIYAPTGWFPALDNDGRISPKNQVPPPDFSPYLLIDNPHTEPQPDWSAGERIYNVVHFEYPRFYRVDAGDAESVDRLEARTVEHEYRNEASIDLHTEQRAEFDGQAFAAIGDEYGQPVTSLASELGYGHASDRDLYVMHRYQNGAPIIEVPVMREYCSQIRAGDWVRVDLSWFPEYSTQRRGMICGAQVLAVYDVDCAWRILLIERVTTLEGS